MTEESSELIGPTPPSTLVDPFAHYADRTQVVLRKNARLVSNSEVQTFKRCRRKWWAFWYRGFRLRREKPTGVRAIGDRLHRALSYWYRAQGDTRLNPSFALEHLIQQDWRELNEAWGSDLADSLGVAIDFWKDADLERAMLEGYVQWITEEGCDADLEILASETYIDARLQVPNEDPELPVYIIAKLDARARRVTDNVRLFIDHKSVGDFNSKIRMLPLNEQMLHYHLIEWLSDVIDRCDGALYNMMRRVKRTKTAKPPFYMRYEVRHNQHELESFRERLIGVITDIHDVTRDLDRGVPHQRVAYPTPRDTCHWDCELFAICNMADDGSRFGAALERYFIQGNPLQYYIKTEGGTNADVA